MQDNNSERQKKKTDQIAPIAYRLAISVPEYWIPLVPQEIGIDTYSIRLVRGKMFDVPEGKPWGGAIKIKEEVPGCSPDGNRKRRQPKAREPL